MADRSYILGRESVRAVDLAAIKEYEIPGIVLMENAARGLAAEALDMIGDKVSSSTLIICGSGNNGGDGYALGRHLHNAGVTVMLAPLGEPRASTDAAVNRDICRKMGLAEVARDQIRSCLDCDLIVDAIFGTGLVREVTGDVAEVIEWINGSGRPVLAVDVPSGLDCDSGVPLGIAVRATRTVTFVGRKPAMTRPDSKPYIGEVVVVGIGAPVELVARFGRPASSIGD